MKKIAGIGIAAIMLAVMVGCKSTSTGDARDTSAYKQNKERGYDPWVGNSFTSGDNAGGWYWKGPVTETGFYASGQATYPDERMATHAAELDGKAAIASHVKEDITTTAQEVAGNGNQNQFNEFRSSMASVEIAGIRRVDRYVADDGTVYVLMFVPQAEIKKAVQKSAPANAFTETVLEQYAAKLDETKE